MRPKVSLMNYAKVNTEFYQAMEEIRKLRAQISGIVQANFPALDAGFVPKIQPPNDMQVNFRLYFYLETNSDLIFS